MISPMISRSPRRQIKAFSCIRCDLFIPHQSRFNLCILHIFLCDASHIQTRTSPHADNPAPMLLTLCAMYAYLRVFGALYCVTRPMRAQAPARLTARTKEQSLGTALLFCLYPQNAAPCFLTPSDARWVTATYLLPSLPILIYE